MACKTTYNWSHDFPKLAIDSGFAFNTHRPRIQLDWNSIKLIDVEKVIKNRDFTSIENHINDVLDVQLESEFDLRILDSGVVKLFRLAQLAVEYQQFCRQYLDRSIVLLRDELNSNVQEIQRLRHELKFKEDEIRRTRKKTKPIHRHHLPYGNENIAAMLLKTLSHKNEPEPSFGEAISHYNKCPYCEKIFLNHLYLQAHLVRRHSAAVERAKKSGTSCAKESDDKTGHVDDNVADTTKLHEEIQSLRERLNEIYNLHRAPSQIEKQTENAIDDIEASKIEEIKPSKSFNDKTVALTNENDKLDYKQLVTKFEEWKKEELLKYEEQMESLRRQLAESVNTLREGVKSGNEGSSDAIEQLKTTIFRQEEEIKMLRDHIINVQKHSKTDETTLLEKLREQENEWRKRIEQQELQHEKKMEQLLTTLENVYKEVKAVKNTNVEEKDKVLKLQALLDEKDRLVKGLSQRFAERRQIQTREPAAPTRDADSKPEQKKERQWDNIAKRKSMEELHRKARELLSRNISLSSSESADSINETANMKTDLVNSKVAKSDEIKLKNSQSVTNLTEGPHKRKKGQSVRNDAYEASTVEKKTKEGNKFQKKNNDFSKSKSKVIRAKFSEEVQGRLQELGVDPSKKGVDKGTFKKYQSALREMQESSIKKDAKYGRIRNKIVAYLDSKLSDQSLPSLKTSINKQSPNRNIKTFFSNVKTKAISMMKPSEKSEKNDAKFDNRELSKRVADLIKTPPGSAPSTPLRMRNASAKQGSYSEKTIKKSNIKQGAYETTSQNIETLYRRQSLDITSTSETSSQGEGGLKVITSAISHESMLTKDVKPFKRLESTETLPVYTSKESLQTMDTALESVKEPAASSMYLNASSSDSEHFERKQFYSEENLLTSSSPKGVLKNATSTSSLSKKKVLFDMDAIQMKSVSASPSQSATDSDKKTEQYSGNSKNENSKDLTNEWDISSIDGESPIKDKKDVFVTKQRQRIAELTHKIESQLANRTIKKPIGGVDVAQNQLNSSNTSIGSSLLDASHENAIGKEVNRPTPAPRNKISKIDSDIDVSDWSVEEMFKGS